MKLLVTGASGVVGRKLVDLCLEQGLEVHAVSRVSRLSAGALHWHVLDLSDRSAADRIIEEIRPSHLVHLAWYTETPQFWTAEENMDWLQVSIDLLRAFGRAGGQRFVGVGSCAEYEWNGQPLSEGSPVRPHSLYGAAKAALSSVVLAYKPHPQFSASWGRIFFLYGPGEPRGKLVTSTALELSSGKLVEIATPKRTIDFVYSGDIAAMLLSLLTSSYCGAINLASGQPTTVRRIVETVAEQLGKTEMLRPASDPSPAPNVTSDPTFMLNVIGRFNQTSIDKGVEEVLRSLGLPEA